MGRLESLRKSILDMSPEELREQIRHVREDRRLSKVVDKTPRAKREKRAATVKDIFKNLTLAQKRELLKQLEGGK